MLGTLARHPTLAQAFHTFNGHVLFATTLSPRQRELLVLRVAAVRDADVRVAPARRAGRRCGAQPRRGGADRGGPGAPGWSPIDRAMLRAVDELVGDAMVTDATWAVLAGELEVEQLMDVVFTVGAYDLLAMAFRSFGVPIDDDLA